MRAPTSSTGGPAEPLRVTATSVARWSSSAFFKWVAVDTYRLYDLAPLIWHRQDDLMKSVTIELRYPGRTVEEVRGMLAEPDFRQAVCEHQGVEDSEVTIEE